MSEHPTRPYLRGLYGVRFLAALSVFYGHLEQAKSWAGVHGAGIPLSGDLRMTE
jgi:peptidoglycan/LPS O-acetylase OafA/YrhL